MTPLRVAAVGLGWVSTNRHIPWLKRTAGVEVVGVIDHYPERVAAVQRKFELRYGTVAHSSRDVPWLDLVDAVTIGASPDAHYPLVLDYLAAGKHVLVEKPMAMRPSEAREMADEARRRGLVLSVVHNFQFSRSVVRAQRLLSTGRLGSLRGVWGLQLSNPERRLPVWYEQLPLGLFYDESPHFFYLLRSFLGPDLRIASASIVAPPSGRATPISVSATVEGGRAPGKIDMAFNAPLSEWHFAVMGSRRMAVVDIFRDVLVVLNNDGEHRAHQVMRSSLDGVRTHLEGVISSGMLVARRRLSYGNDEVIRRWVEACRTGEEPAGISARDGLAVVELQREVLDATMVGP